MKCRDKEKQLGSCITAFAIGIIIAGVLPWAIVSIALAVLSIICGLILIFR